MIFSIIVFIYLGANIVYFMITCKLSVSTGTKFAHAAQVDRGTHA